MPIRRRSCPPACSRSAARSRSPARQGERTVKADDFFTGLFETSLGPSDILTAIRIPAAAADHRLRLRRAGAPARRLRDGRTRRRGAGGRRRPRRSALRLFRRRRDAGAGARRRGGARARQDRARRSRRSRATSIRRADIQASSAAKKHMAGVLLTRVAAQLEGAAAMTERHHDIALTVNGEEVRERVDARTEPGRFPARDARSHRQPCRLRARRLRRLHRARRRRHRARLPDAGGAVRRLTRRDHRRRVRHRRDRRPAGRVPEAQRAAMRLLHARHAADRAGPARARRRAEPRRHPRRTSPATTAAAPAITPSSTSSRRWRKRARERRNEDCIRSSPRKRGPSSSRADFVGEITPSRIELFDQLELPRRFHFFIWRSRWKAVSLDSCTSYQTSSFTSYCFVKPGTAPICAPTFGARGHRSCRHTACRSDGLPGCTRRSSSPAPGSPLSRGRAEYTVSRLRNTP